MKVVTAAEMTEIDRITIADYGIPALVLMERAGLAVAAKVKEVCAGRKVLVLCGSGNNGGDGLVAARILHNEGYLVKVIMLGKADALSADCKTQYWTAKKTGITIEVRKSLGSIDLHGAFVVDAVFGTGLSRPVRGELATLFRSINKAKVPVLGVDIPSGISADTGEVLGEAIKGDYTVTFGLPKRGHFLYPGAEYTGSLCVENIGFPMKLIQSDAIKTELMGPERAAALIPERPRNSYKGDYGHVFVLAGSRGRTGAALMTAKACMRTGSGLVTLGVPESLVDIFQGRVTEEMILPLPDKGNGTLDEKALEIILGFASQKADTISIGPGIGISPDTERIMSRLVQTSPVPLVIDADGLNSLQNSIKILSNAKSPVIITPHPGEMARLLECEPEAGTKKSEVRTKIEKQRISTAVSFSQETGVYVVLKGVPTIVAAPEGDVYINTTGNAGMATAGSGDVLTGIISSLIGQGLNPLNAAVLGVYLHGRAGDKAAKVRGEHSLIASDIIEYLSDTIRYMA